MARLWTCMHLHVRQHPSGYTCGVWCVWSRPSTCPLLLTVISRLVANIEHLTSEVFYIETEPAYEHWHSDLWSCLVITTQCCVHAFHSTLNRRQIWSKNTTTQDLCRLQVLHGKWELGSIHLYASTVSIPGWTHNDRWWLHLHSAQSSLLLDCFKRGMSRLL